MKLPELDYKKVLLFAGFIIIAAFFAWLIYMMFFGSLGKKVATPDEEYEDYYNLHKRNFKLNDELLKVRYIQVDKNFLNLKVLEKKIKRYDSIDKKDLINLSIKFKSFNLNDSIWIKSNVLIGRLPVLKEENLKGIPILTDLTSCPTN